MSQHSTLFEGILDRISGDYAEAEVMNRWLPPDDGDYSGVITKYSESEFTGDDGIAHGRIRLTVQLIAPHDPTIHGKELVVRCNTKAYFTIKENVAVLAGKVIDGIKPSIDVLANSVGTAVVVTVSTSTAKKGSTQTYRNANITRVLESKEVPPVETESNDVQNTEG